MGNFKVGDWPWVGGWASVLCFVTSIDAIGETAIPFNIVLLFCFGFLF